MHKEGPTVTGRQVAARLQGSVPGEDIPAPQVRIAERGEEEGPLYSPQRGVQVRPEVVAEVPRGVEWGLNDSHEWWDGAPSLLRCLGLLRLLGVAEQPEVPVRVAS